MWMLQIEVWVAKRKEPFKRPIIHSNTHTLTFIHSFIQLYLNNNRRAFAHIHMSYNIHSYLHTHSFSHTHVCIHTTIRSYPYIYSYTKKKYPTHLCDSLPSKIPSTNKAYMRNTLKYLQSLVFRLRNSIDPTMRLQQWGLVVVCVITFILTCNQSYPYMSTYCEQICYTSF